MILWIMVHAGLTSAESPWYLFWSGVGADWTRLLALGGLVTIIRQRAKHHTEMKALHESHHRDRMSRDDRR